MVEPTSVLNSDPPPHETDASALPLNGIIQVALIEDNRLLREALTALLNRVPWIRAVAEPPNGHERLLLEMTPDVVLLDLGLENGDSLRMARNVLEDFPNARIIVMDLLPAHEELKEFVSAGVSGFIMKDAALDVVLTTIQSVASGLKVLPDEMTATLFSEIAKEMTVERRAEALESVKMTAREQEVLNLIAVGMSNKAIARDLHISVHTVKSHLRNIMEKLTLHSRLQLAAYAHQQDASD
jgi:two-component system nitrate/nitrite response regulator NarL